MMCFRAPLKIVIDDPFYSIPLIRVYQCQIADKTVLKVIGPASLDLVDSVKSGVDAVTPHSVKTHAFSS